MRPSRTMLSVALTSVIVAMSGCYVETEPAASSDGAGQSAPSQPTNSAYGGGGGGGSSSALGGAMDTARSITDQAEQASADLAAEYDRQSKE